MRTSFVFLIWLAASATALAADAPARDETTTDQQARRLIEEPYVRRGKIPVVKLQRSITASAEEVSQIKKHIANLAKIDRPDFGLSATMSDAAFAPVAGSQRYGGGFLLTDHQIKTTEDYTQLVVFGPRALPFLLEALDDKTPTKLTQRGMFGGLFLATEMSCNPTNAAEQKTIASLPKSGTFDPFRSRSLREYTVKVGDVCFTIIGQIVGRRYLAVRYQPTAIVIVNSPVEEKALAKAVREIWSSKNPAQHLFDSLLFDYATDGVFDESLYGWDIGSQLQCEAALRLLYYFPQETSAMIAERLAGLDVRAAPWSERRLTNGVRADEFIKAVAWCKEPAIQREVLDIFKRTTDTDAMLAALPGIGPKENQLVGRRLSETIDRLPPEEPHRYGEGYRLLVALSEKLGAEAKPIFIRYLQNASLQRWESMIEVFREARSEWAVELLLPALTDKRESGGTYAVVPGKDVPRRSIRLCDKAAVIISLSRPDLPFKMAGEHEDLDRQIATIRARIKGVQP